MSLPYFSLYPTDFLADVGHLGNTELGIYWRLLLVYYRDGRPLPFDNDRLRRVAATNGQDQESAMDSVLAEFFAVSVSPEGEVVWRHARADREILRARAASKRAGDKWRAIPRALRTAMQAERHASKMRATPGWLTNEDRLQIRRVYEAARESCSASGEQHEVDHIVPLRGARVCGLHVPWNLRVLRAADNRAKSNHIDGEDQ